MTSNDSVRECAQLQKNHRSLPLMGILVCVTLSSCSEPDQALLSDYDARLHRVFELVQDHQPQTYTPHLLPAKIAAPDDYTISLWQTLTITDCQLDQLAAKRTDSLAKVAEPVYRWQLEAELLASLVNCKTAQNNDEIRQLRDFKLAQRHWRWQWFLSNQPELRQQFFPDRFSLTAHELTAQWQSFSAFSQLSDLKQQWLALTTDLPAHLNSEWAIAAVDTVRQERLLAGTLRTELTLLRWFTEINQELSALSVSGLCRNKTQRQIMLNVFTEIYIKRVQSYASALLQLQRKLSDALTPLYTDHWSKQSPAIDDQQAIIHWAIGNAQMSGSLAHSLTAAITTHTRFWQHTLQECHASPEY